MDGVAPRRTTVTIRASPRTSSPATTRPNSDRSVNAYRGCERRCIYCFARPTHAFHDLSPGVDFESRLLARAQGRAIAPCRAVASRLVRQAMGTNTDPIDETLRITRSLIELLLETRHPFTITTKSDRVLRDLNLSSRQRISG